MNQKESIQKFMHKWGHFREAAVSFRLPYNDTFYELDSFGRGEQWKDVAKKNSWTKTPVNNIMHLVRQAKVSQISETKLSTKLLPLAKSQMDTVEKMSQMMESYWKHSGVEHKITEVKWDSRLFPIGYLKVKFDGSSITGTKENLQRGDFMFDVVKPTNVYWDPKAFSEEEAQFIFETKTVTLHDLKNTDGYDQDVIADIEEYVESQNKQESGEVLDRNYDMQKQGQKETFTLYEIYYRWKPSAGADFKYGEIHTVSRGAKDEESVEMQPLYAKADLKINRFPIIGLREFKEAHEFVGRSSCQLILDKVKSINEYDAIAGNILSQLSNQQKLVSSASGIDPKMLAKYGNAPGLVISTNTDVNNSIAWVKTPELSPSMTQHRQAAKSDIYEVANITPASLGQNAGSLTTGSGVSSLIGQASSLETVPRQIYKEFIEKVYRTMLEYIVGNFSIVERRVDNTDPNVNAEYGFQTFEVKDFKNVNFDMWIDVRMTQAEIQEQKQQVMQILGLQAQSGQQILSEPTIIDLMDFPDKDRLLAAYYAKQDAQDQQKAMQVATVAIQKMMTEIQNENSDAENTDMPTLMNIAATEAVQEVYGQAPQGAQQATPSANGVGQGAGAPQPAAQAAQQIPAMGGGQPQ